MPFPRKGRPLPLWLWPEKGCGEKPLLISISIMARPVIQIRVTDEHYDMLKSLTTEYKTLSDIGQDMVVMYLSQPAIQEELKAKAIV